MASLADPRNADPSRLGILELTKETLASNARLVEAQLELVRAEMRDLGKDAKRRGIMLGIAVGFSSVVVTLLLTTLALLLAEVAHVHAAWLVGGMTLVCAVPMAVGYAIALRRMKNAFASTERTIDKELQWAKETVPSVVSSVTSTDSADAAKP